MAVIAELLPPYAKNDAGVSETGVGALWFVNALVVVLAQLPVAKLAEGRRRMLGLALMGAIWAATMLIVAAAGTWLEATAPTALLAVAVAAFGIGECLHGTIHVPLTADLAPPRLAGRYLALSSQSWQVGWIAGPAIGGILLPFIIIYLHDVLGFGLGTAGLVVATLGAVGLASGPLSGRLVDRVGPRTALIASLALLAAGYGCFPLIRAPWLAFVLAAVARLGNGGFP